MVAKNKSRYNFKYRRVRISQHFLAENNEYSPAYPEKQNQSTAHVISLAQRESAAFGSEQIDACKRRKIAGYLSHVNFS